MNLVVVCCFVLVGYASAGKDMPPEMIAQFEKGVGVCQPKYAVKDEELAGMMEHQMPKSEEGICFMGCLMKQIGIMTPDNKLNMPAVIQMSEEIKDVDPALYKAIPQLGEVCSNMMDASMNDCAAAKKMMECVDVKGKEMGITKFPFFE